ncbi:MAG: hypothetical protein HFI29_05425 [Lachnospiraceae bacterium]|jgi:phage minor structural protein|nr:hypothetical protein [Lachnospiraceae bacterium]
MIPILFEPKTKNFNTNGIGRLCEAVSCTVTEERNGEYELEMQYPVEGLLYPDIKMAALVLAEPGQGKVPQPFSVYKISKPLRGVITVNAHHISYQLSYIPCSPFTAKTAAGALNGLKQHSAEDCPYSFWTDKTNPGNFSVSVPSSIRSRLGGVEGSILDVFGGEFEFDMYTVKLHANRGKDKGVELRYGKNITDLAQEENISNTITGIYPYWSDSEGNMVELPEKILSSDKAANFPYPRTVPVDFSSKFQEKPPVSELRSAAVSYIETNHIGIPSVSIKVSFVPLWQTEEYKDLALLESVELCDVITVDYETLGVKTKAKIVRTVYDVLAGRYQSLEVGDARTTLASTLVEQNQKIEGKPSKGFLDDAIKNATNWITGVNGGYVVFHKNANGQPYEILIMDTDNIETAKNVWRWNQNGWGHSKSGYHGPYTMAATIDGGIVADFVTAGTMLANRIKGGTLTLGGPGNGNGICSVVTETGFEVVRLDVNGIRFFSPYGKYANISIYYKYGSSGSINDESRMVVDANGCRSYFKGSEGLISAELSADRIGCSRWTGTIENPGTGVGIWGINYSGEASMKSLDLSGNLNVQGQKNRVVKTEHFDQCLLYAYETAEAYFGDIGYGQILEDGLCFVEIDPIFAETVTLDRYAVFLQAEGPGELHIVEKKQDSFTVKGTPGLEFVYEIKAKQKGYEKTRLEKKE